jgi:hypothetical protein
MLEMEKAVSRKIPSLRLHTLVEKGGNGNVYVRDFVVVSIL